MPKTAQIIAGMVMAVAIVLVVTKLSVDSLNPIDVFQSESLLAKVVVGFFLFTLAMQLLSLASWKLFVQPGLENQHCPGCQHLLLPYISSHGQPVRCMFCRRWYHRKCFLAGGGSVFTGCKRDPCPSARSFA